MSYRRQSGGYASILRLRWLRRDDHVLTSQCTVPRLLFDSSNNFLSHCRKNHNAGKCTKLHLEYHDDGVRPSPYIYEDAIKALWK